MLSSMHVLVKVVLATSHGTIYSNTMFARVEKGGERIIREKENLCCLVGKKRGRKKK